MKNKSKFELPTDHLATVNRDGSRIALYPEVISGFWRLRRTIVQVFLVALFILTPWIKLNGEQLVFLDVFEGRISFFGITFWAHDGPKLFLLFISLSLMLAFVTAIWGRAWCGWACPQTVFIEGLFRRIETWIEGNHIKRRQLDSGPKNGSFVSKKLIKWTLFFGICLAISNSLLAYFVGAHKMLELISTDPRAHWGLFLLVILTTSVLFFDFGFFREQFCVLVCPYGRLQSVLVDEQSLVVTYDVERGEPRKGSNQWNEENKGDCVNCYKCVSVCPTGIDIRRGQQLECIQCTSCIDACDSIMSKVGQERGLIRFMSENQVKGVPSNKLRVRPVAYLVMLLVSLSFLVTLIFKRESLDVTIVRAEGSPFREIEMNQNKFDSKSSDMTSVVNHFKLNIQNQTSQPIQVMLTLDSLGGQGLELVMPLNPLVLSSQEIKRPHFFIKAPKKIFSKSGKATVQMLLKIENGDSFTEDLTLLGPRVEYRPESQ